LTTASKRVLYRQVADDIRAQIAAGALGIDDPIPSTSELMKLYGISNTAARNAVGLLRREGLVAGTAGKRVYVIATPEQAEAERVSVEDLTQEVGGLKAEVHRLAEQHPEVTTRIDELQAQVGRLQADLRHLYDRLGQPYPHGQSTPKPKRRTSGA
jgi:DNA-binding GntR family transcriptional regulator